MRFGCCNASATSLPYMVPVNQESTENQLKKEATAFLYFRGWRKLASRKTEAIQFTHQESPVLNETRDDTTQAKGHNHVQTTN